MAIETPVHEALERLLTALKHSGLTDWIMNDPTDPAMQELQVALLEAELALNAARPPPQPKPPQH